MHFPIFFCCLTPTHNFGQKRKQALGFFLFIFTIGMFTKGFVFPFSQKPCHHRLRVERREDERRGRALRIFLHDLTIPTMSKDEVFWRFYLYF
jgi:hypothetical protein